MTVVFVETIGRIGLGTVQFGLDYGVSNTTGQVTEKAASEILDLAAARGVGVLDTASLYGQSEATLGRILDPDPPFRIVTKSTAIADEIVGQRHVNELKQSFAESLHKLDQDRVYGYLVHHGTDILKPGGEKLIAGLEDLKASGQAEKIGVSVYTGQEIDGILERFTPDIVQLPISLADQRLVQTWHLSRLKEKGVEIHARSIFLQGLLLQTPGDLPPFFAPVLDDFEDIARRIGEQGIDKIEACLGFVLGCREIDHVIVGVTTRDELGVILDAAERLGKTGMDIAALGSGLSHKKYIDPSQWQLKS